MVGTGLGRHFASAPLAVLSAHCPCVPARQLLCPLVQFKCKYLTFTYRNAPLSISRDGCAHPPTSGNVGLCLLKVRLNRTARWRYKAASRGVRYLSLWICSIIQCSPLPNCLFPLWKMCFIFYAYDICCYFFLRTTTPLPNLGFRWKWKCWKSWWAGLTVSQLLSTPLPEGWGEKVVEGLGTCLHPSAGQDAILVQPMAPGLHRAVLC